MTFMHFLQNVPNIELKVLGATYYFTKTINLK